MIDVFSDELLSVAQAAKACPGHKKPHLMTIHRWMRQGVRGRRLASVLINGEKYTTREALARFFAETTAATVSPDSTSANARRPNRAVRVGRAGSKS